MTLRHRGRAVDVLVVAFQFLFFAAVIVGGGHGIAPIGYLLLAGGRYYVVPVAIGWLAIGVLFLSNIFLQGVWRRRIASIGIVASLLSWILFLHISESGAFSFVVSIPYVVLTGVCVRRMVSDAAMSKEPLGAKT